MSTPIAVLGEAVALDRGEKAGEGGQVGMCHQRQRVVDAVGISSSTRCSPTASSTPAREYWPEPAAPMQRRQSVRSGRHPGRDLPRGQRQGEFPAGRGDRHRRAQVPPQMSGSATCGLVHGRHNYWADCPGWWEGTYFVKMDGDQRSGSLHEERHTSNPSAAVHQGNLATSAHAANCALAPTSETFARMTRSG